jgi:hypothetical protein
MIRVVTQVLVGLMLLFGTATIIPRAIIYLKLGRKGKGVLYIFLGVLATVFALMSFGYAYSVFTRGY